MFLHPTHRQTMFLHQPFKQRISSTQQIIFHPPIHRPTMSHHRPFKPTMFHHQQLKPEMLGTQLMLLLQIKMLQILLLKKLITLKVDTFPTVKQMGLMSHQAINPNILTELISQANLHTTTQLKEEQSLMRAKLEEKEFSLIIHHPL